MRRPPVILLSLLFVLLAAAPVRGAAPGLRMVVDGYRLFLLPDMQPFILRGRTMVPLRALTEGLGMLVGWDRATQTVTVHKGELVVELQIGAAVARVNGRPVDLDPPAQLVGGRTYMPLRLISEGLGFTVDWDGPTQTIAVTSPPAPAPVRNPGDPADVLRCQPCTYAPSEWGQPDDFPRLWRGRFWAPDLPDLLPPLALGELQPSTHNLLRYPLTVRSFALDGVLPDAPAQLPVYEVGSYPASHLALFNRTVANPQRWEYLPAYSEAQYVSKVPLGEAAPVATAQAAVERARTLLGDLLPPGSGYPLVTPLSRGGWQLIFNRYAPYGWRVFTDHPFTVALDGDGRVTAVSGRRRPILTQSLYPLRSPQDAYKLLTQGRWLHLYITDGSPVLQGEIQRFTVKSVELAYHEVQSTEPRQIMQPYYVFRNEQGQALYVPAVADPWVHWPAPGH